MASFMTTVAMASSIDFKNELNQLKPVLLYGKNMAKPSPLYSFKLAAVARQEEKCKETYAKAWKAEVSVRGWVALAYLNCFSKYNESKLDKKILDWEASSLFFNGPWASELRVKTIVGAFQFLEENKNPNLVEWLLKQKDALNINQKIKLFIIKAELAKGKKSFEEALYFYERAKELDSKAVSEAKLSELLKLMNLPSDQMVKTEKKKTDNGDAENSVNDQLLVQRMEALKKNDFGLAIKLLMNQISLAPGQKDLSDIRKEYLQIFDKADASGKQSEVLEASDSFDFYLALDLAQTLHRRGDFAAALTMASKTYYKFPTNPDAVSLLWIAGRSAQFTGQYAEAIKYFDVIQKSWDRSKEVNESLFREGLIYYRQQRWDEAVQIFSTLRSMNSEKFELQSRYWEIRSLEKLKKDSSFLSKELVRLYPWSYYGLRIQTELNSGFWKLPVFEPPQQSKLEKVWMDEAELAAFHRLKILVSNGFQEEAHFEARLLPIPPRASQQISLSYFYQKAGLWLPAIIQMNAAQEKDLGYLSLVFLNGVFPKPYFNEYSKEAKLVGLKPELLLSLTRQESGFNTRAVSVSNAMGLMQLIPPTAQEVAQKLKLKLNLPQDAYQPSINIKMGSAYISEVIQKFGGSVPLGLAGYNAGPHKVKKWMEQRAETKSLAGVRSSDADLELWIDELPWAETSFYVKAILRNLSIYRIISAEVSDGKALDLGPVWWE